MSNYPPGFYEPREHHEDCNSLCVHADWGIEVCYECPNGHTYHECTCDELHEQDADREAEAYAEYLYDREP